MTSNCQDEFKIWSFSPFSVHHTNLKEFCSFEHCRSRHDTENRTKFDYVRILWSSHEMHNLALNVRMRCFVFLRATFRDQNWRLKLKKWEFLLPNTKNACKMTSKHPNKYKILSFITFLYVISAWAISETI